MFAQQLSAQRDRRVAPRLRSRLSICCNVQSTTLEGNWTALVTSTSRRDVRLIANRPFKRDMLLSVRLPSPNDRSTSLRFVRVSSCRQRPDGLSWLVEGRLDEPIGDKELFWVKIRCPLVHAIEEGPWWVTLRNASLTGLSLIAQRPFPKGALLAVSFPMDTGRSRLTRVVHTRRQQGSPWWVTGSVLLAPLTGRELKAVL